MHHLPEFIRSIIANLISNAILWLAGILGAAMLGAVVLLTRGLGWFQEAGLAVLFGAILVMLGAAVYAASRRPISHLNTGGGVPALQPSATSTPVTLPDTAVARTTRVTFDALRTAHKLTVKLIYETPGIKLDRKSLSCFSGRSSSNPPRLFYWPITTGTLLRPA